MPGIRRRSLFGPYGGGTLNGTIGACASGVRARSPHSSPARCPLRAALLLGGVKKSRRLSLKPAAGLPRVSGFGGRRDLQWSGSPRVRLISWNVNGRRGPALSRQLAVVRERGADMVALQEIRAESLGVWREGLKHAGLEHVLDSSGLLAVPSLSGREYRRIYFNVVASRWPLRRLPGLRLEFPERYLAVSVGRAGAEFELHVAHLPPGSTRGPVKVEMFEALHTRLATPCERPRVLCGDLNTPRAERDDGTVEFWGARHPPHTERWDKAERSVVLGLGEHDLPDVFRALNGYTATDASWLVRRGGQSWGRRYDHVFASRRLTPTACRYHHAWREQRLSDHSAIEADFAA